MTPMQKAERDIEELRQSIRRMFSDLLSLSLELTPEDRAAISKGIQSLQDDLKWEQQKFERGN
jgi:mRNA-degrading endonuclease RelE of RelBE toxin-antitoxin system